MLEIHILLEKLKKKTVVDIYIFFNNLGQFGVKSLTRGGLKDFERLSTLRIQLKFIGVDVDLSNRLSVPHVKK